MCQIRALFIVKTMVKTIEDICHGNYCWFAISIECMECE